MAFGGAFNEKRVFVTGHTGFKGSWLVAWLLNEGAEVYGYSNGIPTEPSLFSLANLSKAIEHHIGDVRDLDDLKQAVRSFRPDFVFHLAAQALVSVSYGDPLGTITTNVVGTANLLEVLREADWPCTGIIVTSDKCYANVEQVWGYREIDALGGKDVYSGSKGAAELVIKSYQHSFFASPDCPVRIGVARAGNVIGGGDWAADRIIPDCIRAWTSGGRVKIRSPKATRPWQHVLEPLSGYLALAQQITKGEVKSGEAFNFGPRAEQNATVFEVLTELGQIWGDGAAETFDVVDTIFHEAGLLKLNCDKALLELFWEASLSYAECIEMTGAWYRDVLKRDQSAEGATMAQIEFYKERASQRGLIWSAASGD